MDTTTIHYRINEPDVAAETFDDEVIVINLANGHYHSIRGIGAWLWKALAGGIGRREAIAQLRSVYGGEPAAIDEAEAFVDQVVAAELLVESPDRDGASNAAPTLPAGFATPLLETFTDMEHLLLIDPIHEVGVQGWPHTPESA